MVLHACVYDVIVVVVVDFDRVAVSDDDLWSTQTMEGVLLSFTYSHSAPRITRYALPLPPFPNLHLPSLNRSHYFCVSQRYAGQQHT